ncbi:MAG TPA: adenylate/guanylate cyclase domain-containing protein [Hanamia sp.]
MIYGKYFERIKNVASKKQLREMKLRTGGNTISGVPSQTDVLNLLNEQRTFVNKLQLNTGPLELFSHPDLREAKLGLHPDFRHLKGTSEVEYHYIVSVFIDIKGSTNLHREYNLEEIYVITNTIQSAAIHTCLALGGHVQRLQGDGVFAYFGGKSVDKDTAVKNAVLACSMFTYFVENDLNKFFAMDEIQNIKTRIGIDFGDDPTVLWANFGIMDVSELTTLSLHTSVACKMQIYAKPNGIVVGQNIKDRLGVDESCFDLVKNSKGEVEKRYIYIDERKNFRYTQYAFDWHRYLKSLPFINSDAYGNLNFAEEVSTDEMRRRQELQNVSQLINSGAAYLDRKGHISSDPKGVHHEPHLFHYGK